MTTGGGLVFGGDANGRFRAYDDKSGKILWEVNLGAPVSGFPISYSAGGKQYIAVSTGTSLVANTALRLAPELKPGTGSNIFVFSLPAEDVVHQVFVRLLRGDIEINGSPLPYLYRAVRNGTLNDIRNRGREVDLDEGWLDSPEAWNKPDSNFSRLCESCRRSSEKCRRGRDPDSCHQRHSPTGRPMTRSRHVAHFLVQAAYCPVLAWRAKWPDREASFCPPDLALSLPGEIPVLRQAPFPPSCA
jgi:hypothetical protein